MRLFRSIDSPWHRLPWTLPTALLIWAVALWGLAYFKGKPTYLPIVLSSIDAQIIEQSASPATPATHQPKPLPPIIPFQAPVVSKASPSTESSPVAQTGALTTHSAGAAAAFAASDGKGSSRGNMEASSGAWAMVRPMPKIPDDLRKGALNFAALARFYIAVDGSVTVELAKLTPNLRLNRILLDSLKKWRFIPAMKNGRPVASTEEILVKIEVK
jgi:periplasmic protein TonB